MKDASACSFKMNQHGHVDRNLEINPTNVGEKDERDVSLLVCLVSGGHKNMYNKGSDVDSHHSLHVHYAQFVHNSLTF